MQPGTARCCVINHRAHTFSTTYSLSAPKTTHMRMRRHQRAHVTLCCAHLPLLTSRQTLLRKAVLCGAFRPRWVPPRCRRGRSSRSRIGARHHNVQRRARDLQLTRAGEARIVTASRVHSGVTLRRLFKYHAHQTAQHICPPRHALTHYLCLLFNIRPTQTLTDSSTRTRRVARNHKSYHVHFTAPCTPPPQ